MLRQPGEYALFITLAGRNLQRYRISYIHSLLTICSSTLVLGVLPNMKPGSSRGSGDPYTLLLPTRQKYLLYQPYTMRALEGQLSDLRTHGWIVGSWDGNRNQHGNGQWDWDWDHLLALPLDLVEPSLELSYT
jgi:hypothetical protein